jgi:glutamate-ammonia-ligase adenylyltransferase
MNDTQTHIIPDENEIQNKLAKYIGIGSSEELISTIRLYQKRVRNIYNNVLKSDGSKPEHEELMSITFKSKDKAEKNLKYLRTGIGLINRKEFDSRIIELFNSLEPELLLFLKTVPDADRTLENFVRIFRAKNFPSIWYNEFSNAKFFKNFLTICTYSQRSVDILSSHRSFEDFFFSRKVFIKITDQEPLNFTAEEMIFLLSFQYALKLIDAEKVSHALTSFVSTKINELVARLNLNYNFFIGGLGSFGSQCMSFASDIDLIVVTDDVEDKPDIQKDFQNFLAEVKSTLKPFDVDFRLRPEGKKSPLVLDIKNYNEYLDKRARIWEFQTFSKLRFVCGDEKLFVSFRKMITSKIATLDSANVAKEINHMYSSVLRQTTSIREVSFNMKKTRGSLVTIDFVIQYFSMLDSNLYKNTIGKSAYKLFALLITKLDAHEIEVLKSNFVFLRELSLVVQNIFNTNQTVLTSNNDKKILVSSFLKMKNTSELDKKIAEMVKFNNSIFDKYVKQK